MAQLISRNNDASDPLFKQRQSKAFSSWSNVTTSKPLDFANSHRSVVMVGARRDKISRHGVFFFWNNNLDERHRTSMPRLKYLNNRNNRDVDAEGFHAREVKEELGTC